MLEYINIYIVFYIDYIMENTNHDLVKTGVSDVATETLSKAQQVVNDVARREREEEKPYWNGKKSDLPIIQEMIRADNEKHQIHENKFEEVSK